MVERESEFAPSIRTLARLISDLAATEGDRVAVHHRDGSCTYSELEQRARSVARSLWQSGVRAGDRVALLCTNRIEWLETYFGASFVGATVHAINTWVTAAELADLLEDSDPTVFVLLAEHGRNGYLNDLKSVLPEAWDHAPGTWTSTRYPHLREIVVIEGKPSPGLRNYDDWARCDVEPSARPRLPGEDSSGSEPRTAVVLYTSGSAAKPKAVPLVERAMLENGFNIGSRMGLTTEDRVWLGSPLFWSYGCANALMATFTHGATLVLQEQFTSEQAIALIEERACTAAYLLPTMTRALIDNPDFSPDRVSSLRTGLTIGSPEDLLTVATTLGIEQICNVYGSTETYGNCCVTPHDAPLDDRLKSQGPPLPGVTVRIVEPGSDSNLPSGDVGEIQVHGYLTPGYLGTSEDPSIFTSDGFYRTGDLGYKDGRGWLHFTGRATEMIKTSGINVAPAEVEQCLMTHPGVEEVAVVGIPDPRKDELVVAFVVARAGAAPVEDELIEHCRSRISSFKVPVRVEVVSGLPRTGTGKLSRRDLRNRTVERLGNNSSGHTA